MKVYRYDTRSGIYQGEEFVASLSEVEDGGATVVAPPPCEKGFVPSFDPRGRCWIMSRHDGKSGGLAHLRSVRHTVNSVV